MNQPAGGVPKSFWAIAAVALIWNLMGVMQFFGYMNSGELGKMAVWGAAAFGVAVFAGAIGSILLLMKKAVAAPVFLLSLIGVLVQLFYNLAIAGSTEVYGPGEYSMMILIPAVAVFLVWYARSSKQKGWIA